MLVSTLKDAHACWSTKRLSGKCRLGEESRIVLDFCLVRGIVLLLETVFKEEYASLGNTEYDHSRKLAQLCHQV
jgi:hypothetical protein